MDSSRSDQDNNGESKLKSRIPPLTKIGLSNIAHVENASSKIPKREGLLKKESFQTDKQNTHPTKTTKKEEVTKPSTSMMNLRLSKNNSQISSKSCLNSQRSAKSKDQTPRQVSSEKISEIKKKAERATSKRLLQQFQIAKEKLQNSQEQFLSKLELVKDELPKEEKEYKMICLFNNNEGVLVTKATNPTKIQFSQDKKTLEDLKKSWKNFATKKLGSLDTPDTIIRPPKDIGDTANNLKQIEEERKKLKSDKQTFLDEFLNHIDSIQASSENTMPGNKELESKFKNLLEEAETQKKQLEETQNELNAIKKNCGTLRKELENKNKTYSKQQFELDETKKKYDVLEKETTKLRGQLKEAIDKLTKKSFECDEANQKLKNYASKNANLDSKNKDLESVIEKLKAELEFVVSKESTAGTEPKLTNELLTLRKELAITKKEKETLETETTSLQNEIFKLQKTESKFLELQDQFNQVNKEKQHLSQTIIDLENELSNQEVSDSMDLREKVRQLQAVHNSNIEKIKILEQNSTKAQFQIKKLEEKIILDGKLLKIRTDLIDSLQKKEHSQKVRLTDLFTEVSEKNNDVQLNTPLQLKTEVLTKTEEFQNLFSTLSAKQIELTRQEHMIKLLQENNDRAQNLRVRQEAKIAKLEEEILALKHTIAIYQDAVIPNQNLRRNLAMAEANREAAYTDSLDFYVEERRKKRHIDISVKKYEK